jgi:hypothetical protein
MTALVPQHEKLIADSAISAEVASERGYKSIVKKVDLDALGFGRGQQQVPALVAPIHDVDGNVAFHLARPDEPREKNGRRLKYEMPMGTTMVVDVPPRCRSALGDPDIPLYITEGTRKADAAVSKGLCCISLIGTWCWRGTNEKGGTTLLPDFESIALNGRKVFIVFDSDVMTKRSVHGALERFGPALVRRKAKVRYVYLPHGEDDTKVGLDDYFAGGATVEDLLGCTEHDLRPMAPQQSDGGFVANYEDRPDGIIWHGSPKGPVQLTNFSAKVSADIVVRDGIDESRELEISAVVAGEPIKVRVGAEEFTAMNWVVPLLGPQAAIGPGPATRDLTRHAVQMLSGTTPRRDVFQHLGWSKINDRDFYLHAGGAISASGSDEDVEVEVSGTLADFVLPEPPSGTSLRVAIEASLELVDLGAEEIVMPLLAAIFRAPLGGSDFSLFLAGASGQFKTATAAICQQHWGAALDERNLPESFRSTPNAIEGLLYQAKDALVVVDEFAPGGTQSDTARAHRDAERVLRSQGNLAGRSRMRADGSLKPPKRPRGLTIATGEDVPDGQSLRARMLVLEFGEKLIDVSKLTGLQDLGSTGVLASSMAGFVGYLAANPDLRKSLTSRRDRLREELSESGGHRRTASLVADLLIGITVFTEFAVDAGALDPVLARSLEEKAKKGIVSAAGEQDRHQKTAEPTERFRTLLSSALASGLAHIAGETGDPPEFPKAWGWREKDGDDYTWSPCGDRIGWTKDDEIYLDSEAALRVAQRAAGHGHGVAVTVNTLRKRLHERGLLASTESGGRGTLTTRRLLGGRRRSVLHVVRDFLDPVEPGPKSASVTNRDETPGLSKQVPGRSGQSGQATEDNCVTAQGAGASSVADEKGSPAPDAFEQSSLDTDPTDPREAPEANS